MAIPFLLARRSRENRDTFAVCPVPPHCLRARGRGDGGASWLVEDRVRRPLRADEPSLVRHRPGGLRTGGLGAGQGGDQQPAGPGPSPTCHSQEGLPLRPPHASRFLQPVRFSGEQDRLPGVCRPCPSGRGRVARAPGQPSACKIDAHFRFLQGRVDFNYEIIETRTRPGTRVRFLSPLRTHACTCTVRTRVRVPERRCPAVARASLTGSLARSEPALWAASRCSSGLAAQSGRCAPLCCGGARAATAPSPVQTAPQPPCSHTSARRGPSGESRG